MVMLRDPAPGRPAGPSHVQKLASSIVQEGALTVEDAVGWVTRLAATLELIQVHGRAHGRVSAKAVQVLGRNCNAAGFFLDTADVVDDVAYHSPDRIAGAQSSPEDDTWALGVMLYFALTAELPFAGMSTESVGAEMLVAEVAPLSSFGVAEPRLQQIIDAVFSWDPNVRLHSARSLRSKLCEAFPFAAALPPLKLGKPKIALFDDEDESEDDEGQKLTAVLQDDPSILQARIEHAKARAAEKRAEAAAASPRFDAAARDPLVEDEPEGGIVDELSIGDLPVLPMAPPSESGAERPRARRRDAEPSAPGGLGLGLPPLARAVAPAEPAGAPPGSPRAATSPRAAVAAPPEPERPAYRPPIAPAVEPPRAVYPRPAFAGSAVGRRKSNGRLGDVVLAILFLAVGGLGSYLLFGPKPHGPVGAPSSTSAAPSVGVIVAAPGPSATASGSGAAAPPVSGAAGSASAAPQPTVAPGPVRPGHGDLHACVKALFPAGTFPAGAEPHFDHLCSQADARKGGHALRVQVIKAGAGGRGLNEGMHEWSLFGWYEMAAFAVARTACCKDPSRLATGQVVTNCALDAALDTLGKAAIGTDDKALQDALRGYRDVITCLVHAGTALAFGQTGPPDPGAAATFDRFIARLHKAQGR